jgi:hypothetical protein
LQLRFLCIYFEQRTTKQKQAQPHPPPPPPAVSLKLRACFYVLRPASRCMLDVPCGRGCGGMWHVACGMGTVLWAVGCGLWVACACAWGTWHCGLWRCKLLPANFGSQIRRETKRGGRVSVSCIMRQHAR